jgi:hypothetical protein
MSGLLHKLGRAFARSRAVWAPVADPVSLGTVTIREGIAGVWHFHVAVDGVVLCGKSDTMATPVPLASWGYRSEHTRETYCDECAQMAAGRGIRLGV